MIRSELKKKAQSYLHGYYGNWSLLAIIPIVAIFIYFFCVMILFQSPNSTADQSNNYQSWQDNYSGKSNRFTNDYQNGYDDGYFDGYDDGYDEGLYQDDFYNEEDFRGKNLDSISQKSVISPLKNTNRMVTYAQPTTVKTRFKSFFAFLFGIFLMFVTILYRGMIQWAAVDNLEGNNFSLKTVFAMFIKENGKRTVSANILVTLYTFLWSLLFVIPGIIKQLSYGMTNYLLRKDAELTPKEAMQLSQALMQGYRLEYIIFSYSFVLWQFATFFSFGLASVYVIPYYSVSEALFFDQIIEEKHHLFTQEKEAGFADF
ncbi:hypothetical protein UAW_02967 [Enterococcus haemoperoxidus ATCC BAA-382]|uniref:Integral membrane protein n=1 Tax=Enterococcus haemoperoxidus ATCC BAA-382 TaxID=1158608 RepID=R2SAM6_9ENTE|nr:DUF975 family protein [Enterococcus haemoperoxidus]EOH92570.1 hypothetical protein UAW_02967 [Enterococcus haemoperoxidus ATCC BAA-382]EOT61669.1 hypothetical protein I583_00651 [Enterococcus haemoperoxidus ATCC BAA-382]OJG55506.1 hypothetical protein RV06_GL001949 [Enterococcus haemoperoxidus]